MSRSPAAYGALGYLILCLLLGGSSGAGAAANAALQISAVVIILLLLWRSNQPLPLGSGPILLIGLVFVAVTLATLIPLPSSIWTGLPFRDGIAAGFGLLDIELPALPLSLAPRATVASLLSLLPPTAMFLLVLRLDVEERRLLPIALLAFAAFALALSGFQLAGGTDSPLRPYQITNPDAPVGFFANVNHQVTLLLCALPFTGFLAARAVKRRSRSHRSGGLVISTAVALLLASGIAISGSSAGYGLFPIAALAAVLIYRHASVGKIAWPWAAGVVALLLLFGAAAIQGPLSQETLGAEVNEQPSSRGTLSRNTGEAIAASFPVGTGLGTFATVYRQFENPNRTLRQYANHAHNDYLELSLELGLAGMLLILAFVLWWLTASVRAWRADFRGAELARAGSVVIGIVLLHSIVDYPLRTAAIAAVVAAACAFLVPPRRMLAPTAPPSDTDEASPGLRHLEAA